ncbi:MAG: glycoside hydrolase family 78 protein [Treponema sp.]|jgi:alpha-L-rhamnosidase|nr:glycoside hydrolase family 78 protein [Treponema sp.]
MDHLKPTGLRTEYAENPIGVQSARPLLAWRTDCDRPGGKQTAWQVVAAAAKEELEGGEYTRWNSGKVAGSRFCGIPYNGSPLSSAERVWWKVRIWDEEGKPGGFSDAVFFEMGLLETSSWKGRWMSFLGGMVGNGIQMRFPFKVEKKVRRARAYIAGIGYYEMRLNGSKIGDKLLDPGATDYSKTILYSAYDVTANLRQGDNVAGIVLGTGWAGAPKTILQLNIEYDDGAVKEVVTDWGIGWLVARGPITYNSLYDGEDYDARLEKDGWDTPEYGPTLLKEHQRPGGWILGTIVEPPGGELVGEISPPVRVTAVCEPKLLRTLSGGRELYDGGANRTGWVRLRLSGERGARVNLSFAEVLNAEGDLDKAALRSARAEDNYILRGDKGVEEYAPRFTYHGFRYFTVKKTGNVKTESLSVEFVRSDLPRNAVFSCDNEFLNRMADVMWHTDACNMFSVPTDSSQRDERLGWTTDTTARVEGCVYHFDVSGFFNKWLRDIFDTQSEDGYFADTAPHRWGRRPCDPSVNTPALLPLLLYHSYGNRKALEDSYEPLKRYIQALLVEADNLIISRTGFGEWACPADECYAEEYGPGAVSKNVDPSLVSTAYLRDSLGLVSKIASILGKEKESSLYADLANFVRMRFNEKFFNPETCQYDKGSQSSNTLALYLDLVEPRYQKAVAENIAKKVREKGNHFTTGNMGTKAIVETLSRAGMDDLVYDVMTNRTSPGFGYMLEQGATTIWERWEADRDNNIMNSRNHPMFASCVVWFYKYLGGISMEPYTEAFQDLLVAPHVPGGLSRVEVTMDVPAGKVRSAWEKSADKFVLKVEIPFNAAARVLVPAVIKGASVLMVNGKPAGAEKTADGGFMVTVPAGRYEFVLGWG